MEKEISNEYDDLVYHVFAFPKGNEKYIKEINFNISSHKWEKGVYDVCFTLDNNKIIRDLRCSESEQKLLLEQGNFGRMNEIFHYYIYDEKRIDTSNYDLDLLPFRKTIGQIGRTSLLRTSDEYLKFTKTDACLYFNMDYFNSDTDNKYVSDFIDNGVKNKESFIKAFRYNGKYLELGLGFNQETFNSSHKKYEIFFMGFFDDVLELKGYLNKYSLIFFDEYEKLSLLNIN